MDLETARRNIQATLERMRVAYRQPVFDEWAILAVPVASGGVVAYSGPRPDAFKANLARDAQPLRTVAAGKKFTEGDIEFVADAKDTHYDAFMKIGAASYLVLNHTAKTMEDIRADARWLAVQREIFDLSEKFRADPLER